MNVRSLALGMVVFDERRDCDAVTLALDACGYMIRS